MAGAHYYFDGPNCTVKTSPPGPGGGSQVGGSSWCPDAPSAWLNYNVEVWNNLFPN